MTRAPDVLTRCLALACIVISCSAQLTAQRPPLSPAPTPAELAFAASALADPSAGPFFAPEQLGEAVALIRQIHAQHPATRNVAVGSDLSLEFSVPESLFSRLFTTGEPLPADSFVDRSLKPARTGLAPFDRITDSMGGATAIRVQSLPGVLSVITVWYRQPVNIPGVARAYASLRPVIDVSPLQGLHIGDGGNRVHIEAHDSLWSVYMWTGWGDCPAGCINRHFWQFKYHRPTGGVETVVDSGPPVPSVRDER